MAKGYVVEMLKEYYRKYEYIQGLLIDYLKDTDEPLDERWGMLSEFGKDFCSTSTWVVHFKTIDKIIPSWNWVDHMGIGKYETTPCADIVERLEEYHYEYEPDDPYIPAWWTLFTPEVIEQLKEEILQLGLYSFTNNW